MGIFGGLFGSVALSFLRQLLLAGGTVVVSKGYLDGDTVTTLVGALMAFISSHMSVAAAKAAVVVHTNITGKQS